MAEMKPYDGEVLPLEHQGGSLKPYSGELKPLDFDPAAPKGITGHARDLGLSALKSAIAVPETLVGLADIPTGGRVGKALENEGGLFGFRPKEAKQFLSDQHTDQYKAQQREFQEADGVLAKTGVALQNPSLIANTVTESVAPMLAGGVAARGLRALAPRMSAVAAGAAGEGAIMAGAQAESIRQETDDGLLTSNQTGAAALTGVLGSLFGFGGASLAKRLGIGDVDTMLARGSLTRQDVAGELARMPAKSIPRQVVEGAITEGFLEELPQSISEQIIQNLALDKPWSDGVEDAAVMGTLAGMVMGGGASMASGVAGRQAEPQDNAAAPVSPQPDPQASPQTTVEPPVIDEAALGRAGVYPPPPAPIINDRALDPVAHPSLQMGLDPSAGPMSAAAALAVDSGATSAISPAPESVNADTGEITRPEQAQLPLEQPQQETDETLVGMRERLAFIEQQARTNGGWDRRLIEERSRLQNAIAAADPEPEPEVPATSQPEPSPPAQATTPDAGADQNPIKNGTEAPQTAGARWDSMDANARAAVLARQGGWATKSGFLNVVGKNLMGRGWEAVPEKARARIERLIAQDEEGQDGAIAVARNDASVPAASNTEAGADVGRGAGDTVPQRNVPTVGGLDPAATATAGSSEPVEPAGVADNGRAAVAPAGIAGKPISREWTAFAQTSGTLSIPRAEMPQIKAEHRGAMVNFMNARGVTHEQTTVDAGDLKPTQAEFSPAKVARAKRFDGGDRSILVSSDGYVLDGHHQWLAKREAGEQIKIIRLNAPIRDLVTLAREFPSSTNASGASALPAQSASPAKPKAAAVRKSRTKADAHAQRWSEMTLAEREALALSIGQPGIFALKTAQKRWDRLLEKVRESLAAKMSQTEQQGELRFSQSLPFRPDSYDAQQYALAVDRIAASDTAPRTDLTIGDTPAALRALGAKALPIQMPSSIIHKASRPEIREHNVPISVLRQVPALLADPVMVFDSQTEQGALVALVDARDSSGRPVVVAVHLDAKGGGFHRINKIASIYGKDDIADIQRWMNGSLRYYGKQKASGWLRAVGLQLPEANTIKRLNPRVITDEDVVNLRYSFAGQSASTADHHALGSAMRRIAMGENAETVRRDTGWHRGADGQWRFEISDEQARLAVGGKTAAEVLDAASLDGPNARVADMLDHPQLFAAYPHLENIRVELMPAGERAAARLMRSAAGTRLQIRGGLKSETLPSVMLHELQHAIQNAEGFATGGSARNLTSDLDRSGAETYRRLAGEVEARNTQSRMRMTDAMRRQVSPELTADVPSDEVIVTFNGQVLSTAPKNTGSRLPVNERGLLRALRYQFPGLVEPTRRMLERGRAGAKGGLVVIDSADPLRVAGTFSMKTGRALDDSIELFSEAGTVNGFFDPRSGLTFLVGPNLDPITAPAVLLHEMIHGQQREKIDAQAMSMLMNRSQEKDASTRAFLDRVAQRMVDAGAAADSKEAAAYIVEQAVIEGRSRGYRAADSKFLDWVGVTLGPRVAEFVRSVAAMVRTWMIRHGGITTLTVDDLVGYAMAGLERAAVGQVQAVHSERTAESRRAAASSNNLPDVIVANPLGAAAGADHDAAKRGDVAAAGRLAMKLVTPELLAQLREQIPRDAVVVGVDSIESTGRNGLPSAAANLIASKLGLEIDGEIVQSTTPKRTTLGGLDRIFRSPEFDGAVTPGRAYVLVDDTFTQGGTFAAMASHIEQNGGRVAAIVALTGKQYSSKLRPEPADLQRLRDLHGDLEDAFRQAAGYDFGGLTASEARYLANFRPTVAVRNRILAEVQAGSKPDLSGNVQQEVIDAGDRNDDAPRFSRAGVTSQQIARNIGDGLKSITVQNIRQAGRHKLTDWMKLGLQFLGRRQLVEVYGDVLPLAQYDRLAAQMEADKNDVGATADDLARRWGKLPDEQRLAELMHDATLAQIDADSAVPYVAGDDRMRSTMLKGQFKALSADAQKVYREARDHYRQHHAEVRDAIRDRIGRSELKNERKAEILKRMDDDFFKAVKGVYFPLARFGQYVVVVKDADGKVESVSRAETMPEAEAMRREMVKAFPARDGYQVGRVVLSKEFVASRDMVGRGFMTELYEALDQQNLPAAQLAELEDTLGQLYLSSLPDLSWAKHGIHRKGTPGFSQDARRAFAQNTFHGARYLAKLRYGDQMQTELDRMQKHVDEMSSADGFDQPGAQRVVDEMNKRHDAMMNPKSNPLSTALTSLGFVYYLGLSPAAAAVNLSQTALVAYPVMGAKWGFKKAGAALLKASGETLAGKNDMRSQLTDADEIRAYDEAVRTGTIDVTMAHDLAGIAQGEDAKVMWKIRPVMRMASFLFHHAERFNRQATFIAAYRLAKEAGSRHDSAYEQAVKATYDGHFDYSAGNRPRVMQGNVARVVLLFKQYAQNMIFTLARNAYQSVAGESDEVKREARKVFGALLTTHAAAAGVLGLPFVGTLLTMASAIGGSDDEPWDAEAALRNMLAETFGPTVSEVISKGFSRLTPWDISGRVGLNNLLLPDVQESLEGQRWAESFATAMLGPVIGMGVNAAKGAQKMADGDYGRGLEDMLPIFMRNPIKAYRLWDEGAIDRSGIAIKDEVSTAGALGQLAGFSPSEVRLAFEGRSAVFRADRRLAERRAELMSGFARAAMDKDAEAMAQARDAIAAFNQANPGRRITAPQMWQSVRARQRRIDQAQDGVYLPRNRRDALEAGRFANP